MFTKVGIFVWYFFSMENADTISMENADTIRPDTQAPTSRGHHWVVLRALTSAALFGVLGGMLGHWLGTNGKRAQSNISAPIMKWGMGLFSATLAAYSSLKVSEQEANASRAQAKETAPLLADAVTDQKIPLNQIQTAGKEYQGEVAPPLEKQRG